MIVRQFPIELALNYPLEQDYELDKILFFDIETTGFSAESTYLYLIGCIYHKDSSFYMLQWFSEDLREETELLTKFFEFLKSYDVLIHYNGTGFDIPYLTKKCRLQKLPYSFENIISIDLYKKIFPIKKIFHLSSHKQKSIEAFLGVSREDVSDGGDLIQVYQSYLGKKHIDALRKARSAKVEPENSTEIQELLHQLLLHNEDDLKGLVEICPILYYADLFNKPIRIEQAGVYGYKLVIRLELAFELPVRVSIGNDQVYFSANERTAYLTIKIYEGEMKYFYADYKDYYYLTAEDTAVHKSLALFVDKDFRQKAKPSNCYTRKSGVFAPLYAPILSPVFKHNFRDKLTFIEVHTDFLLQEENLEQYVSHVLQHMVSGKL